MERKEELKNLIAENYSSRWVAKQKHIKDMDKIDEEISIKEKMYTMGSALLLGILYTLLFYKKSYGISYSIFTILFTVFFLWSVSDKVKIKKSMGWFLLLPIFLLSFHFSMYSNEILRFFNMLFIPVLVAAGTILIVHERIEWHTARFLLRILHRAFILTFENIGKPFSFIKSNIKLKNVELNSTKKNILKGLVISIPLLAVIIVLLTSADMVFEYYITNLSNIFNGIGAENFIWRCVITVVVFLYTFGYIWSFKYPYGEDTNIEGNKERIKLDGVTILTIVFVINVVYLIFSIIQFSYLYGGGNRALPAAFTYAEYARRGFFELVAVTILNLTILLCSMKYIEKGKKTLNKIGNISLSLLVLFTVNMLFSAHYKMSLYENSYGFTYLRVFVHIFMLLLFFLFCIAFIGIWNKKVQVVKTSMVVSLVMYVFINYINVDVFIAEKNIERYYNTKNIDVEYLTVLSYDALPVIKKLEDDSDKNVSNVVKNYLEREQVKLSEKHSWWEFNYSKYKARKSLLIPSSN